MIDAAELTFVRNPKTGRPDGRHLGNRLLALKAQGLVGFVDQATRQAYLFGPQRFKGRWPNVGERWPYVATALRLMGVAEPDAADLAGWSAAFEALAALDQRSLVRPTPAAPEARGPYVDGARFDDARAPFARPPERSRGELRGLRRIVATPSQNGRREPRAEPDLPCQTEA